ncbi:hypothetical protein [Nonomuraea fuscirosea]|uniref:hypothetical protein n=1 Tax=Nonomuraea fuscirosea TaxID=1291556 RepID=UPI0033F82212
MMTTDSTVRSEFIAGLRELAQFLADNPKVPVPSFARSILLHAKGDNDEQKRAVVDRVAALLGSAASGDDHYKAVREFGPLSYEVLAINSQHRRDYEALMSYAGAVSAGEC